jgi:hypothetical protein
MPSRILCVASWLCLSSLVLVLPDVQSQEAKTQSSKIELHLSLARKSFPLGTPVKATVQIANRGSETIFVPNEIHLSGGFASMLDVWLEDARGRPLLSSSGAADGWGRGTAADFCKAVVENWAALPPGHFYGRAIDLTADVYIAVKVPGRYRMRARYISNGMNSASQDNPLAGQQEKIAALPFMDWKGEIESNPIWIEITSPAGRRTKQK